MPSPEIGIPAGASLLGGFLSSSGQKEAANTQAAAAGASADIQKQIADQQIALQREQFNKQIELQQPFQQAGTNALAQMQGGAFAQPAAFTYGAKDYQADPGYAFRLAEGQKALDRQAAARGGLISGGALKAAQRYGQEAGSQEFGNAVVPAQPFLRRALEGNVSKVINILGTYLTFKLEKYKAKG